MVWQISSKSIKKTFKAAFGLFYLRFVMMLVLVLFLAGCVGGGKGAGWFTEKQAEVIQARSEVSSISAEPNNIVLMLPLKGGLAATSQAIRNGFLAAYYHERKERPNINIKVVDTTNADIPELYQQALIDGVEVVVGPLTKKEVETVLGIDSLPIPTIALNTLDDYIYNFAPNLYQFGLLPQDEAAQVATKMLEGGHDHVAVIVPENAWGDKISRVFQAKYEESGGQVIAILNYNDSSSLSEQLCPFLAADESKLCSPKKHRDKKQNISNEPMRRQDINTIFLVATPDKARQIVPLLKFYYAGDLPFYSISAIYTGVLAPSLDRDIDGVYFCDTPWVLNEPSVFNANLQEINRQIITLWPASYTNYKRLYALGIDAYNLASKLNVFLNSPQDGFDGASGKLYLDSFNHIYRELKWARFRDGFPVAIQ